MCALHKIKNLEKEMQALVPLQEVAVNARIESGLIKMDVMLEYANVDNEGPIEV